MNQEKLETLQQRTMALDYPLLAEYDFRWKKNSLEITFIFNSVADP